jgi:hypothetical protein
MLFLAFVIVPLLASVWLTRKWAYEDAGTDLDEEGLSKNDIEQVPRPKRFVVLILLIPAGVFLLLLGLYFLISLIVLK